MILGAIPPKNFPLGGRTLLGDGIPNRKKVPRWKKSAGYPASEQAELGPATLRWNVGLEDFA
jgi:hypothetical protein